MRFQLRDQATFNPIMKTPKPSAHADAESPHAAEKAAHKLFGVENFWLAHNFDAVFHTAIPPGMAAYLASLPFFFIATANQHGACDCSFRGRNHDSAGRPDALLQVIDTKTIIFPDYSGNNYFNSLGNILVNGQIGMLFVDFESRHRVRINGRASIIEDRQAYLKQWPLAQRYIQVTVEQVFGNCRARIPRMKLVPPTDSTFQDE